MRPSVAIDGEKIARLRVQAGMTQEDLKDALGLKSRQAIWKIEAGGTTSPITLRRLAIILRVDPSELELKEKIVA